jgi:membrane protease YdiL (CAAX protease family)
VTENQVNGYLLQFSNWHRGKLFVFMIVIDQVISIPLVKLFEFLVSDDIFFIESSSNDTLLFMFLLYIVFAPVAETIICQLVILEGLLYFFYKFKLKNGILFSITISGLVFGFGHSYNWYYVFVTFFIGLLYSLYYLVAKKHKNMNPFWTVVIVHSMSNLFSFIIYDL